MHWSLSNISFFDLFFLPYFFPLSCILLCFLTPLFRSLSFTTLFYSPLSLSPSSFTLFYMSTFICATVAYSCVYGFNWFIMYLLIACRSLHVFYVSPAYILLFLLCPGLFFYVFYVCSLFLCCDLYLIKWWNIYNVSNFSDSTRWGG